MSELSKSSYQNYEDAGIGDTVHIEAEDPKNGNRDDFNGTIFKTKIGGKTKYIQTNKNPPKMIELRSVREDDTGEMAILLAIDGKEISDTKKRKGFNSNGLPIHQEQATLSFDYRVKKFSFEERKLHIG